MFHVQIRFDCGNYDEIRNSYSEMKIDQISDCLECFATEKMNKLMRIASIFR